MPDVVDVHVEVVTQPPVDVDVIIPPQHEVEVTIAAARGKSAYEQAVEHGFSGTVEEWLDSLHGELSPEAIAEIRADLTALVDDAGTWQSTPDTVVRRDTNGNLYANRVYVDRTPISESELVPKLYVDSGLDEVIQAVEEVELSVTTHIVAPEPHPAYDDLPSLTLLFENGIA